MSSHFEPQRNDRSKRPRRSFADHGMVLTTIAAEQHSQYHPNQLPLTSPSQSPSSLSTASQYPSPVMHSGASHFPEDYTPIRRGKRKAGSKKVLHHHFLPQRLNNEGVQCIHRGQYEEAISNIARAIHLSQSDGSASDATSVTLGTILNHYFRKSRITPPPTTGISPDDIEDYKEQVDMSTDVSEFDDYDFVYSRGIMLPPSESQAPAMGESFHVVLSFNLALAHHLAWNKTKDIADSKRLNHVVQLYELAYRLALQIQTNNTIDTEISRENNEIYGMRFTLIIINNLSQIHQALNGEEDYHVVLEGLLSHLMVVATVQQHHSRFVTEGRAERDGVASTAINLEGFFQNVLPLLLLKSDGAGAA
ncbi:MAG: hypothetical protein SGBAC_006097 [Bacillariaceae sp.]